MAGTAWNAGLRPAQRPAGPRRRRPQSPGWLPSRHVPPTDEMAYSRRRHGRDGLEPPPGERGQPPAGTRGSAKPGRMTRRQASVSAARFLPGGVCGGPDHAGSCRWDPTQRPPGSRAVPCRPPSRNAGTWPALRQTVSATPLYGSRRTRRLPPRRGHLGTGSPSRRPPSAGCAGRRPAFQAVRAIAPSAIRALRPIRTARVRVTAAFSQELARVYFDRNATMTAARSDAVQPGCIAA